MATSKRADPFSGLLSMQRDLDDIFDNFFAGPSATTLSAADLPIMDIYNDNDKEFVAEVHVPGYEPEEVDIRVQDNILEINGRHEESIEERDKNRTYMMRQSSASFHRSIALPKSVDADKLEADFEDGILRIRAPYNDNQSPSKKIAVKGRKTGGHHETKNSKG